MSGLTKAASKPRVLLLEAGGENDDHMMRIDGKRFITMLNEEMSWGYKTVPQPECENRELDYARGKGLGGSSSTNFGVYSIGARDDYDEWARLVGDDDFAWSKIQPRFKRLETFNGTAPAGVDAKYISHDPANHGTDGPLHVGYPAEFEKDLIPTLDVFEKAGYPINPDHNSGNPLGFAVGINSSKGGIRTTAQNLITPRPDNLTVRTKSPVQRLILEGTKVVGVEANGNKCKWPSPASARYYYG